MSLLNYISLNGYYQQKYPKEDIYKMHYRTLKAGGIMYVWGKIASITGTSGNVTA